MKKINTVIFGATGSIGTSALSIISKNTKKINLEGVTCDRNLNKLNVIAKSFNVRKIGFNEDSISKSKDLNLKRYEYIYKVFYYSFFQVTFICSFSYDLFSFYFKPIG